MSGISSGGFARPSPIFNPGRASARFRKQPGHPAIHVLRKYLVNSAKASSLKLPLPPRSLRCFRSQVFIGIERLQQRCVRHQPHHASVSVEERVNPRKARRPGGYQPEGFTAVHVPLWPALSPVSYSS